MERPENVTILAAAVIASAAFIYYTDGVNDQVTGLTTGAAEVITVTHCIGEIVNPANP